jgi:exonuclease III
VGGLNVAFYKKSDPHLRTKNLQADDIVCFATTGMQYPRVSRRERHFSGISMFEYSEYISELSGVAAHANAPGKNSMTGSFTTCGWFSAGDRVFAYIEFVAKSCCVRFC